MPSLEDCRIHEFTFNNSGRGCYCNKKTCLQPAARQIWKDCGYYDQEDSFLAWWKSKQPLTLYEPPETDKLSASARQMRINDGKLLNFYQSDRSH